MAPEDDSGPAVLGSEAHRLARLLRHEVGDLLQSVYSTVGILLERLPDTFPLERRLAGELKSRAELCKVELDAVLELVSPLNLAPVRIDLVGTVHSALQQARRRFPGLPIPVDSQNSAMIEVDARCLSGGLSLLFLAVCQGAKQQVQVRVQQHEQQAECTVQRDGYGVTQEQLSWLQQPFATTQHALLGLALALTQRVVRPAGGAVTASNRPEGGISVRIVLPLAGDN